VLLEKVAAPVGHLNLVANGVRQRRLRMAIGWAVIYVAQSLTVDLKRSALSGVSNRQTG
jgi:hypothetical protein